MSRDEKIHRPVVVASFLNPNEAHIFKGLLESEGIESFVYHENAATFMPIISGGVQVAVKETDLEKAIYLLEELRKEWHFDGSDSES